MADTTITIDRSAQRSLSHDPATLAAVAMREARTDQAYARARDCFIHSRATTLEGVAAKIEFVQEWLADVSEGDELSADAWAELHGLLEDARRGVVRARSH